MAHPLDKIPEGQLRRWQLPSVIVGGVCLASLPLILPGRETDTLLDLVESGSAAAAAHRLAQWTLSDRVRVAHAVGLDFLMNPAYLNSLAIAAVWSGRVLRHRAARTLGSVLAWLAWSAVLTNVMENIGLFRMLVAAPADPWPFVVACAHYWAGVVIVGCALFALVGLAARIVRGATNQTPEVAHGSG